VRDNAVNGVDLTGAGAAGCSTGNDNIASVKSFIANLAAATGDVILRVAAADLTSPRRMDDRADITLSYRDDVGVVSLSSSVVGSAS